MDTIPSAATDTNAIHRRVVFTGKCFYRTLRRRNGY
jgi:hypothetical protein